MAAVQTLLAQVADQVKANAATFGKDTKYKLRQAALALARSLETPEDAFTELMTDGWSLHVLRISSDAGWLDALVQSSTPLTIDEIATKTNTNSDMVLRFLRACASLGYLDEPSVHTFASNEKTRMVISGPGKGLMLFHMDFMQKPLFANAPAWFSQGNYEAPKSSTDTPWAAFHGGKSPWEIQRADPKMTEAMRDLMIGESLNREDWTHYYPCVERMVRTSPPPEVLLVDVGGGSGHDIKQFNSRNFGLPGKTLVQDMKETFDTMTEAARQEVNAMPYDFFQPQPVKGAGNYYMHHVPHDWSDDEAVKIIKNTADAMTPDSRFLLNEFCLPDSGVNWIPACHDMIMMFGAGGKERSKSQWEDVLSRAGLKILEIFPMGNKGEAIIECALA